MDHGKDLEAHGYAGLDPGIRELVRQLNKAGVETFASCEGHQAREMPHPWVAMIGGRSIDPKLERVMRWVAEWNSSQHARGESKWAFSPVRGEHLVWHLIPNRNNGERNPEVLRKLRKGAEFLADFLRQKLQEAESSKETSGPDWDRLRQTQDQWTIPVDPHRLSAW